LEAFIRPIQAGRIAETERDIYPACEARSVHAIIDAMRSHPSGAMTLAAEKRT
jgi:hypothetical protein